MRAILLISLMPMALANPAQLGQPSVQELATSTSHAIPSRITDMAGASQAARFLYGSFSNGSITGTAIAPVVSQIFLAVVPTSTPTSIPQVQGVIASVMGLNSTSSSRKRMTSPMSETSEPFFTNVLGLLLNGIAPTDMAAVLTSFSDSPNSFTNVGNPDLPAGSKSIYPKASPSDAPYSQSEESLREGIHIPPTFTYGKKMPIVIPGATGSEAGYEFTANIGKLLAADGRFEPVYVNVPANYLIDIAISAEYVAYSLHYISELTNQTTALLTWSQGSIAAQWAFKYWPSTQKTVTDSINLSGDYHGTLVAYLLCNGVVNPLVCDPSILQQTYFSNFTHQLRQNNGDSAYVPTTTVYSTFDEIVQPQEGTAASGYIFDARNVGTSNNYLQEICAGEVAAGLYDHEGVLYNAATWAIVLDALTHDGPADFKRVGKAPCQDIVAVGLSLEDVLETEAVIPLSLLNFVAYPNKVFVEPALPAYATF